VIDTELGHNADIEQLLLQYNHLFSTEPGHATHFEHAILTAPNQAPVVMKSYRTPLASTATVAAELDEMLRLGIIQPSDSLWNSPIVIIRKKTGDLRFCIDFRALNKITTKDPYPMPHVDDLRDQLNGARIFSSLDLTKGYWHVPMNTSDKHKTAFSANNRHWEFNYMPFGLKNAPATFQKMIMHVIRDLPGVVAYIDDILLFTRTPAEHVALLKKVFDRLEEHGLRLNRKKCSFFQTKTIFLGHTVDGTGVAITKENAAAVQLYPTPQTPKELAVFLALWLIIKSLFLAAHGLLILSFNSKNVIKRIFIGMLHIKLLLNTSVQPYVLLPYCWYLILPNPIIYQQMHAMLALELSLSKIHLKDVDQLSLLAVCYLILSAAAQSSIGKHSLSYGVATNSKTTYWEANSLFSQITLPSNGSTVAHKLKDVLPIGNYVYKIMMVFKVSNTSLVLAMW
jgi:hypothetical protein